MFLPSMVLGKWYGPQGGGGVMERMDAADVGLSCCCWYLEVQDLHGAWQRSKFCS